MQVCNNVFKRHVLIVKCLVITVKRRKSVTAYLNSSIDGWSNGFMRIAFSVFIASVIEQCPGCKKSKNIIVMVKIVDRV